MKIFRYAWALGALVTACMAGQLAAQTNPPIPPSAPPAAIGDRPTVVPPVTTPDRPQVPDHPEPAKDVKNLVKDFQTARDTFVQRQQELNRQLKTATVEQRAVIRAQLKESLNVWLEDQKSRLQELREQAKDIKNNVPSIKDVIDAGGGEGGRGR